MKENSIEEDIKILKELGQKYYKNGEIKIKALSGAKYIWALQNLLSDYKRVLKENEELHKEIDRMKSLDIYKLVEDWETGQLISIQKVKDKIKELNSRIEKYREYVDLGIETDVEWVDNVANRETVKVLQELLEK